MLRSDGNRVEIVLRQLLDIAKTDDETEKKVYSALESILRHYQDIYFETTIEYKFEDIANVPIEKQSKNRILIQTNEKNGANIFENYLSNRFGFHPSHKELIEMATEIGPKYGILITRNERRSKIKILAWFYNNFHIMKEDINSFSRKIAQNKEKPIPENTSIDIPQNQ